MLTGLQRAHLIVYSLALSPCGQFLAAVTNFGHLLVLRLRDALKRQINPSDRRQLLHFGSRPFAPHGAFCLRTFDQWLVCGAQGRVEAWSWPQLIAGKATAAVWSVALPPSGQLEGQVDCPEVNGLAITSLGENPQLFAGGGDNLVHQFDIGTDGRLVRSFAGHTDFVHALVTAPGITADSPRAPSRSARYHAASASEDGSVRLWDVRQAEAAAVLVPEKVADLARPEVGKFITSLAVDAQSEDWLVCGGGPHLANWHLSALRPTTTFEYEGSGYAQNAAFLDDRLISVGSDHVVRHWQLSGETQASVPGNSGHGMHILVAPPPMESAEENDAEKEHILVCGNSSRIDVCAKLGYIVFSLDL